MLRSKNLFADREGALDERLRLGIAGPAVVQDSKIAGPGVTLSVLTSRLYAVGKPLPVAMFAPVTSRSRQLRFELPLSASFVSTMSAISRVAASPAE
jgi:hypothetical protein